MSDKKAPVSTFTRLQNRYRLVVMNDDTYEEITNFKLTRLSVYIGLCTVFVLLLGLTIILFMLTPLKYYIPGYGRGQNRSELQALKIKTDSLQHEILVKDQYLNNIRNVLSGNTNLVKDTVSIAVPKTDISND